MFSSNSFNVCPHCGKANSLNARYCSSCGKQLVMPQEVVVCHRCHKTNSPLASFCGACGAPLRVGAKTKICPKCHRELDINTNVCSCGYNFTAIQYTAPQTPTVQEPPAVKEQPQTQEKAAAATQAKTIYSHKGGRAIALVVLILLMIFAFLVITPYYKYSSDGFVRDDEGNLRTVRFGFLADFDKGILTYDTDLLEGGWQMYGADLIAFVIDIFVNADETSDVSAFQSLQDSFGVGGLAILTLLVVFILVTFVQMIVCVARLINGKRCKRPNYFYLILALLSTLWIGGVIGFGFVDPASEGVLLTIRNIFVPKDFLTVGYITYLFPVFFWLLFIISALGKARKVKEKTA